MSTKVKDFPINVVAATGTKESVIPSAVEVQQEGVARQARDKIVVPAAMQSTAAHCVSRIPGSYDYCIIDPAATEFNRGGFCYLPYLLANALKASGYSVYFYEDFTTSEIDTLPEAKEYLVALWSATQKDACLIIDRFLGKRPKFFGYYGYVDAMQLPEFRVSDDMIKLGMVNYPRYYHDYKTLLLSDCDTHLSEYAHLGAVYPLFLSYGCFRKCVYCPSAINTNYRIIYLDISTACQLLKACYDAGIRNIHFTDEEFFGDTDRTHAIFSYIAENLPGMYFITLGSMPLVAKYLKKYKDTLVKAGLKLVEIGFETADEDIQRGMLKPASPKHLKTVLSLGPEISIFWLTITFYPGETLSTLNETGDFLGNYGLKRDKLVGRVATNATRAGLGQYFQSYDNAPGQEGFSELGITISVRPVRLIPSFVPHSFLNDVVVEVHPVREIDYVGFFEYRLHPDMIELQVGKTVQWHIDQLINGPDKVPFRDAICLMALYARVGAALGAQWVNGRTNIKRYYDYLDESDKTIHDEKLEIA